MSKLILVLLFCVTVFAAADELALDVDLSRGMSLRQVACLRVDLFTCQLELKYFDFSILELAKWIEVVSHRDQIQKDLLVLQQVAGLIQKARFNINQVESVAVLAQLDESDTVASLNALKSNWAHCQVQDILQLLKDMNFQSTNSQKLLLADKILEKLNFMIVELTRFLKEADEYQTDPQLLEQKLQDIQTKKLQCYPNSPDGCFPSLIIFLSHPGTQTWTTLANSHTTNPNNRTNYITDVNTHTLSTCFCAYHSLAA